MERANRLHSCHCILSICYDKDRTGNTTSNNSNVECVIDGAGTRLLSRCLVT
jgi:hypothetical protein